MKAHPYEVHYKMRNKAEWLWSGAHITRARAEAEVAAAEQLYFHEGTRFVIIVNFADQVATVIDPEASMVDLSHSVFDGII